MNLKSTFLSFLLMVMGFGAFAQNVLWSEEFNGSIPAGWQNLTYGAATDLWSFSTAGPQGQYLIDTIASTTAANGFALFDSDLLCSGNQNAWLISPAINMTGQSTAILYFEQQYRRFYDSTYVKVSVDGTNWTTYPVNQALANNDFCATNPTKVYINISSVAANQATVYVAFQFLSDATTGSTTLGGCGYSWMIDDIQILDGLPAHNTQLWLANRPYDFRIPEAQVYPLEFALAALNNGNSPESNPTMGVTVTKPGNVTDYTVSIPDANPFNVGDTLLLAEDPAAYTPNTVGVHRIRYNLTQDATDGDASDNQRDEFFEITPNVFSKATWDAAIDGPRRSSALSPSGGGDYEWGVIFNVLQGPVVASQGKFCVAVNDDATLPGLVMTMNVYSWNDADQDGAISTIELTQVGYGEHQYAGGASFDMVTVDLYDNLFNQGISLAQGSYFVSVKYANSTTNGPGTVYLCYDDAVQYNDFLQLNDVVVTPIFTTGWFGGGFGGEYVPSISLTVSQFPVNVNTFTAQELEVSMFPNPTSEFITSKVNFTETQSEVTYQVYNAEGNLIKSYVRSNISQDQFTFDVRELSAGTYSFVVSTPKGAKTQSFVVAK